ncbi:MAG: hypothetical protein NE330_10970 [Lentisphaeraceae bacterium]|nr:hypothetical protein [Lentisphaeraceae bacterium]
MIKNLMLLLVAFFVAPSASGKSLWNPNTDVLEINIELSKTQKDLFFSWASKEYERHERGNWSLSGKALSLCKILGDEDVYRAYFLNQAYGIKFDYKLTSTDKVLEEAKKFANGDIDQKMIAWYIFDYMNASNPSVELREILEKLPRGNWEYIVPLLRNGFTTLEGPDPNPKLSKIEDKVIVPEAYFGHPRSPKRMVSSVNGLIVSSMANHRSIGAPARITANVIETEHKGRAVYLDEETGLNMKRSVSNAELALHKRFPALSKNHNVRLAFEYRESHKDGNSAGVAFALLLYSIYEDIEIDDKAAVTGVILPNLSVKAVGGVPSKVRGAHITGIEYVVIPEENKEIVSDMTLLYELSTVWRTQIFTASKFTDALKIARVDRDKKTQEAINRFSKVSQIMDKGNSAIREKRDFLLSELEQIVKLTPNHESAKVLIKFFKKQRPKRLSLNGSADLLFMVVDRTLRISVNEAYKTSEEAFVYNRSFLKRSSRMLDPITARFTSKLSSYITTLIKYRNLLEKNILKDSSKIGTAFGLLDKEGDKLEKTRNELNKIWAQIVDKM